MKISSRKTHTFIELKIDEIDTIIFAKDKQELKETIENLKSIIEDLESYLE